MKKLSLLLLVALACASCSVTKTPGGDKDKHGCIGSAGYTWSEVQKDCIRLFEKGIRVEAVDSNNSAFIVFSKDSTLAEVFLPLEMKSKVLKRHLLPSGEYVYGNKAESVKLENGVWTINNRDRLTYRQKTTK